LHNKEKIFYADVSIVPM